MAISLLENSLRVNIFFDDSASDYDDNICIRFVEECPEDEKLLKSGITNMYITPEQACLLILDLKRAMAHHRELLESA